MDTQLKARLARLTRPIFIETLLMMSLGTIDVFMLSQISDTSVAAVGLVNQLLSMIFLLFLVGATGTAVVCSQYLGAKQDQDFRQTAQLSLLGNLLLGALVSLWLAKESPWLVSAMNAAPSLAKDAIPYCRIVGGFAFLHAISVVCVSVLRSREMAIYPMYVQLTANIVNILANYCLIFGHWGFPAMGVHGAAWATVLSRCVGLILLLYALTRHGFTHLRKDPAKSAVFVKAKQILAIGLPGAGEMFSYTASQVVITYFITSLGVAALAARTYVMHCVLVTFLFAIALGQAASIMAGHLVGSHHYQAAKVLGEFAIRRALILSILLSILLAIAAPFFFPLLTTDPDILRLCTSILLIDIALEGGRAVNILTGRLLAAVGDPLYPLRVSIVVVWTVATAGSYLVGIQFGFGLIGMWWMFVFDEGLRASLQWRYWRKSHWMQKSLC